MTKALAAVVMLLVVAIATRSMDAALTAGQVPATPVDPETRFEVVSIKLSDPFAVPRASNAADRYSVVGVGARGIVSDATRIPPNRIIGLPDWASTERYTIVAKAPEGTASTNESAISIMLTNLLKDRFKMTMHIETRAMPVYNLAFVRSDRRFGPALKESSPECRAALAARAEERRRGASATGRIGQDECESVRINPGGTALLSGVPMDRFALILTPYAGRPLINKTGLTSYYDITLKWTREAGSVSSALSGLPANPVPLDPDAPNLFTAMQEQLGLKLENASAPLDVVVIDSIQHPTPD